MEIFKIQIGKMKTDRKKMINTKYGGEQMELDIKIDFEDRSVKGACPFRLVKEGEFHCLMKIKDCGSNENSLSKCGKYGLLLERWLLDKIRVGCNEHKTVEIGRHWFKKENIVVRGVKYPVLPDVWETVWNLIGKVPCKKCQPKKPKSRVKKGEKDKLKGGLS